jgi:holo-[acyl-carrier protein] synthase
MILGLGVDVCDVERIEIALRAPSGRRFRARVFTEAEAAYCEARGRTRAQSYAATFAAKEAALKALRTGWADGLGWHDVALARDAAGAPSLALGGAAKALAARWGVRRVHVTLSHAGGLAIAVVVLEGTGLTRRVRSRAAAASTGRRRRRSRPRSR